MMKVNKDYFNSADYFDYLQKNFAIEQEKIAPEEFCKRPGVGTFFNYVTRLGLKPGQKVLEIGVGLGRLSQFMQQQFGIVPYGIDVAEDAILACRKSLGVSEERIKVCDAEKISFADESFDSVVCWAVFDLTNQGHALPEMIRVLKTGGSILITGKADNFHADDADALIAEEKSREKGIPNRFTDFGKLLCLVEDNGCQVEERYFFERRGDFMANKLKSDRPENFLEYCLILRKAKKVEPQKYDVADFYSKTWRRIHG